MPIDDVDALFWYDPQPPAQPYAPVLDADELRAAFQVSAATALGRGTFGETWWLHGGVGAPEGPVAAKVIYRPGYRAEVLAREVSGLRRTSSPHVVRSLAWSR